jgi:putative Holliday junction resolvase
MEAVSTSGGAVVPALCEHGFMGAVLSIDYGTKRVGLAVTDATREYVFPRDTMLRSSSAEEVEHLQVLCREDEVDLLAVGLPVNADGTEGPMAVAARKYAAELTAALHISHVLVDERYTSQEAEEYLRETHPKDTRKRRHMRDRVAAVIILRTFLEHGPVAEGDP